jgi:hypothetical protein
MYNVQISNDAEEIRRVLQKPNIHYRVHRTQPMIRVFTETTPPISHLVLKAI